jgi:hypothetical protein
LVDCLYEYNTLSITQTNSVIKAVKHKKMIKMTKMTADVVFVFAAAV